MLVQLTFLAPKHAGEPSAPSERLRLLVPRSLVESGEGGSFLWVADQAAHNARRKPVKLGPINGELVEIVEGLNAADKVIASGRDGLKDGARITVTGEDTNLGVTGGGGSGKSGPARLATGKQGK
jgi:multidrug efflux system membrane fusion protein